MNIKTWFQGRQKPKLIMTLTLSFVALSLLATYLIDVLNVFGARDFLVERLDIPYFWFHWFFALPVIEIIQWFVLGAGILVYALGAGIAYNQNNKKLFYFLVLMATGLVFMVIEDAGDVRHMLRGFIETTILGHESDAFGYIASFFELTYFGVIGAILLFALIRFKDAYWDNVQSRKYLFIGFISYGVAVGSSFAGRAFAFLVEESRDMYTLVGERVFNTFLVVDESSRRVYVDTLEFMEKVDAQYPLEFLLMDSVYEESLELIGAGALLAAGTALLLSVKNNERGEVLHEKNTQQS